MVDTPMWTDFKDFLKRGHGDDAGILLAQIVKEALEEVLQEDEMADPNYDGFLEEIVEGFEGELL